MNITRIHELIHFGVEKNWKPEEIQSSFYKSFNIKLRLSFIKRFYRKTIDEALGV